MRRLSLSLVVAVCACAHLTSSLTGRPVREGPPDSFISTTAETRTTRIVTVRDGLSRYAAFHQLVEALSDDWTVDVSDPRAGFVMTTWRASQAQSGVPDLRYRTRIVARFVGNDWRQVSVTAEANWQRGDDWDVGTDSKLLAAAVDAISARLATR